ncbi:hypothetical protein C7446_2695 [Kushneria sinocarnis]|uniref:Uncharacterized protein n=1 Tax=Kushneria sinocarnis TaxID=595502 RepID=A0A420WTU1_9GAMM|nr:hypothetical protein [Kushneria sinocarnis]RKQ96835.1 hypothetical protein C7446_2695 [Kushneria sinocarnis]
MRDFSARTGLDFDPDSIRTGSENSSYLHRTLALARFLNHFTYRDVADKKYLVSLFPKHKPIRRILERFNHSALAGRRLSSEELLGSQISDDIESIYNETNPALARETGLPLAELGYPGLA